jgi:hypothetical protein
MLQKEEYHGDAFADRNGIKGETVTPIIGPVIDGGRIWIFQADPRRYDI